MVTLTDSELKVLKLLKSQKEKVIPVDIIAENSDFSSVQIISTATSLQQKNLINLNKDEKVVLSLSKEGKEYLTNGLPEKRILPLFSQESMEMKTIQSEASKFLAPPKVGIAIGWLRKNKFIDIKKEGKNQFVSLTESGKKALNTKSSEELALDSISNKKEIPVKMQEILRKRKLIIEKITKKWTVSLLQDGIDIVEGRKTYSQDVPVLTRDHIETGQWKDIKLKSFDVTADPPIIYPGKYNPYLEFLDIVREILIGMGFEEAKGPLVEAEFYNFDGLFQAQNHIAREIHDSYILEYPQVANIKENNFVKKVRQAHETGLDPQSTGWGYKWNFDMAKRLVLRTQTTAVSLRELIKDPNPPKKVFSIDRNYRPDTIDRTHAIEFRQCEGIVLAKDLTVRHLIGYLKEFANQLVPGTEIKFKPAYFPFTEPSVEAFIKIPKIGWVEMLGSGLFRPELLRTLGIDYPNVQCLAWGIGIDRFAMIKLALDHIKHLHSPDLEFLRNKIALL